MIRAYFWGAVAALIVAALAFAFWQGRQSGALDRANDEIETNERLRDVEACDPDAPWLERLRGCKP